MKKEKFAEYIKTFDFRRLFNELGWDSYTATTPIEIRGVIFKLCGIAEKRNFPVFECISVDGAIPFSNLRKQIEHKLSTLHHHHFVIYTDKNKTHQVWQLPYKEENKPKRMIEVIWRKGQDVEPLFQRLKNILFTLDEEDEITLIDVIERMKRNFATNNEQVTRQFYTEFKKQHTVFLDFINGIDDHIANKDNQNKQWYASLMLNRLMFCYFIQKKGFLDQNINYLQTKLSECKRLDGVANFYGFYRSFLLELFHDSLAKPENNRKKDKPIIEFGRIPYLNGGLFDIHQLEHQYRAIEIDDVAFERIFDFFDQWNWHLDTSKEATGRDINPDVIGYIFEKYINDRASMGAYYTKEDITEYIGKNTIIPFLLDKIASKHSLTNLWDFVACSDDKYIYDTIKKGANRFSDIPVEIAIGIDISTPNLLERRKDWNTLTPEEFGLPTEIWRETIARLQRYFDVRDRITSGEIQRTNDLITYNLNIRQAVQDFVQQTEDAVFIKELYKALKSVTILDPTCGSGAFLFAAMNILEPLYGACVERMEDFADEQPGKHNYFEEQLAEIRQHPNLKYYIFKTIILGNLYGVDIMHEAVEIAKLRLFLKLVAEVDVSSRKPNFGLEPLPDIDFNIRAGNTLVGFATEAQLEGIIRAKEGLFSDSFDGIKEECILTAKAYEHFQNCQLINDMGSDSHRSAKSELHRRLDILNEKLNHYCAHTYGIDAEENSDAYREWKLSHLPFHWFAEFYRIIHGNGGFDVIIGNPPYVEWSQNKLRAINQDDVVVESGNLYSAIAYRCLQILSGHSAFGFIIPISFIATKQHRGVRNHIQRKASVYYSSFDIRPDHLFDGAAQRLTIVLRTSNGGNVYSEKQLRWYTIYRPFLFDTISYSAAFDNNQHFFRSCNTGLSIVNKAYGRISEFNKGNSDGYWVATTANNFIKAIDKQPRYSLNGAPARPSGWRYIACDGALSSAMLCFINSSLFYYLWKSTSDGFNLTGKFIEGTTFALLNTEISSKISPYRDVLMQAFQYNSETHIRNQKTTGRTEIQLFRVKPIKPIIDEIDKVLAEHYGFTEEELDFIINYDIKYRMGKILWGGSDDEDESEIE